MRLFFAIELPENAIAYLSELQKDLDIDKIRLVSPSRMHITLCFLGEIDDPERIISAVKDIKHNRFILKLSEVGGFPDRAQPKVIWAGVKESSELAGLHRKILSSLDVEDSFSPHITLGRIRSYEQDVSKRLASRMKALKLKPLGFRIDSFKLLSSELLSTGPSYKEVAEFKLN